MTRNGAGHARDEAGRQVTVPHAGAVLRREIGCRVGRVLTGAARQIMSTSSSNAAANRRFEHRASTPRS